MNVRFIRLAGLLSVARGRTSRVRRSASICLYSDDKKHQIMPHKDLLKL